MEGIISKIGTSTEQFKQTSFATKIDLLWEFVNNGKKSGAVSLVENLVVLTLIRQEHSRENSTPDFGEILEQPSLMNLVCDALSLGANKLQLNNKEDIELIRYIKLEALWILSNAAYGEEEDCFEVLLNTDL